MPPNSPRAEAISQLTISGFTAEAIENIKPFIDDAPAVENVERRALYPDVDPTTGAEVIRSWKIYNLTYNWGECVIAAIKLGAATFLIHGEPISAVHMAIEALHSLNEAREVTFSEMHAKVIRALWVNSELEPITRAELKKRLEDSGTVPPENLDKIVEDLARLQVIKFGPEGSVRKREKLVLRQA
jgi:hypothetical protein